MEVHHHSHPSPSSGHRKKWTHYFWEFLMLFLAVYCGFMAENIREHKIEHQREKQYMVSLYQDLKTDTFNLGNSLKSKEEEIGNSDSFFHIFRDQNLFRENTRWILFCAKILVK